MQSSCAEYYINLFQEETFNHFLVKGCVCEQEPFVFQKSNGNPAEGKSSQYGSAVERNCLGRITKTRLEWCGVHTSGREARKQELPSLDWLCSCCS